MLPIINGQLTNDGCPALAYIFSTYGMLTTIYTSVIIQ